jgi:two-component system response regulator RegA
MLPFKILLVDDDDPFRERLAKAFSERGYIVSMAHSLVEARALLKDFAPTHAVLDLRLASESGLDLVPELKSKNVIVVMLTGYGSVATALEAVRLGAVNYLSKPAGFAEIERALFGPPLAPLSSHSDVEEVPSLSHVEWEHIQRVLRDCEGNITHAAKKLGMHRQALQRKLRAKPTG